MSLNEENLKTYLENAWDTDNADAPSDVTIDEMEFNYCNKLLVRKIHFDPKWVSGLTKQITEVYELRLSHPEKEDGINELVRILMAYPGTQPAIFEDLFTGAVATGWSTTDGVGAGDTWTLPSQNQVMQRFNVGSVVAPTHFWAKMKNSASGKRLDVALYFGPGATDIIVLSLYNTSNAIRYSDGATVNGVGPTWVLDTYYLLEARNIDWTTKTYDFYVDNVLIKAGAAFSSAYTDEACYMFEITNYSSGNVGTIDECGMGVDGHVNADSVPINVNQPQYRGRDGEGNYVHTLTIVVPRWE